MNQQTKYSRRTVWIHWVSTLLIFSLIYTGIKMEHEAHTPEKFKLYKVHFSLGVIVFLLTIIRVMSLIKDSRPEPLYPKKSTHQKFIKFVHYGFYIVIFWMCVSGILSVFLEGINSSLLSGKFADLPEISKNGFHPIMLSHHIVAKIVFLLLFFHISGFLIHLLRKNENTFKRIWF